MFSDKFNINTFLLLLLLVLVVAFTDNIFNDLPVLKKLFNDQVNYILVIALVILITLLDMPCGIILAFLVLYLSVYMNKNSSMSKSMGSSMGSNMGSPSISIDNNVVPRVRFSDTATIINSSNQASIASDSEFVYNNTNPFPNNNLMPFQPVTQEIINMSNPNQEMLGCSGNAVNTTTQINDQKNDYLTQIGLPNRDGFDVTGCRYDFKNSPQNLTNYGPPLAQCATYSGEQTRNCGTVFYPLNA
jgi:hypothetical protein